MLINPPPLSGPNCDPISNPCTTVTVYASDTCLDGMPGWSCTQDTTSSYWIFAYWDEIYDPQAPSKAQNCAKGLKMAGQNQSAVDRANNDWDMLQAVGDVYGVDPAMLAAIGIRESGFQNSVQPGPFGANTTGIGIFQITNGSVPWMNSLTPMWAASYAASLLSSNMSTLATDFPNFTPTQLLQATAASYNFGAGNISGNPATIDYGSAPATKLHPELGNYGSDILLLMDCF